MEIVNKILHLWVKVMSHRGEASMKHDGKVCDFCPIITPLDYIKLLQNFQKNICAQVASSRKLLAGCLKIYTKENLAKLLLCEFCKIFKNTYFAGHL